MAVASAQKCCGAVWRRRRFREYTSAVKFQASKSKQNKRHQPSFRIMLIRTRAPAVAAPLAGSARLWCSAVGHPWPASAVAWYTCAVVVLWWRVTVLRVAPRFVVLGRVRSRRPSLRCVLAARPWFGWCPSFVVCGGVVRVASRALSCQAGPCGRRHPWRLVVRVALLCRCLAWKCSDFPRCLGRPSGCADPAARASWLLSLGLCCFASRTPTLRACPSTRHGPRHLRFRWCCEGSGRPRQSKGKDGGFAAAASRLCFQRLLLRFVPCFFGRSLVRPKKRELWLSSCVISRNRSPSTWTMIRIEQRDIFARRVQTWRKETLGNGARLHSGKIDPGEFILQIFFGVASRDASGQADQSDHFQNPAKIVRKRRRLAHHQSQQPANVDHRAKHGST